MTLPTHEFIRRFLTHVLPKGFHRIRHYGLFANGDRAANIARARELLGLPWAFQGDRALGKRKEGFVRITGGSGARPPVGWRDG